MTARLLAAFAAPVLALPLDLFRALVGLVSLAYCARLLHDVPLFFAPDGLMAHAESRAAFWFTWQPLFQPGASTAACTAILLLACALALGITLGLWPRRCAALLYLIVVCGYRFNFLLLYIDDAIIHLLLFWLVLMPVGQTLTLPGWRGRAAWRDTTVSGATARLFLGNLVVLYTVAGLTKLTSPLWRAGDAVYAALRIPAGWFADVLGPQHLPLLRAVDYATLVLEPLFAVVLCLPAERLRPLRRAAALVLLLFHLGIIATLDVPFANLGCLTALPLLLRGEWSTPPPPCRAPRLGAAERFAALALCLITGAAVSSAAQAQWRWPTRQGGPALAPQPASRLSAETGGPVQSTFFSALWLLGLAQQYRLLDWIDHRNYHMTLVIHQQPQGAAPFTLPASALLPRGMRSSLLLSYLAGVTWMPVPRAALPGLRRELHRRLARRHCRLRPGAAQATLQVTLTRIDPRRPQPAETFTLSRFRCAADGALVALDETYHMP